MKYFLATYEIRDGEHEHSAAAILVATTLEEASKMAQAEEYDPETDSEQLYFSYGGDGTTACTWRGCVEITEEQMRFLEQVGLAYRMPTAR